MGRWLAILVLSSAAFAQAPGAAPLPKLDPGNPKAFDNALRALNPFSPKSKNLLVPRPFSSPRMLAQIGPAPRPNSCAIPLLEVPVNPNIDLRIQRPINPNAPYDNMPVTTGLPPCPQQPAARRGR